ncbi:phosphatase PAP2 family protein [Candidatus Daviesbacteria bacterium]|nr:phosphatase PAP2 family protein [Candidatus Daviesbacteria bacterium]
MIKKLQKKTNFIIISLVISTCVLMIANGLWFSPDQFFVLAGLLMLIFGRFKNYLKDWTLPVFLLLLYDYLRGILPHLAALPHVNPMVKFGMLKGFIWGVMLQRYLSSDQLLHWYDFVVVFLYMTHFVIPMIISLIFWLNNRKLFKEYMYSLVVLSYLALISFVLFPTMPPWMAAQSGYIPHLDNLYDFIIDYFPHSFYLPSVYQWIDNNLVAALPSMHAAYPWLTFLYLRKVYPKFQFALILYVISIWFTTLYLGEHYSLDIIVAILYAQFTYMIITRRKSIFKKVNYILGNHKLWKAKNDF